MKKLLSILVCIMIAMSSFGFIGCNNEGSLYGGKADVTYTVTIENPVNGTLISSKSNVVVGESVTFTATPNPGYVLAGLYINGGKADVQGNTYTVENVLRDFDVTAEFALETITLTYAGEGADGLGGKVLNFNEELGELATPSVAGSYFIGWENEDGEMVTEFDKATALDGEIVLTAVYGDYAEELKPLHTPFSITTTYYDANATEYGITWHTKAEPVNPVLLAVEGEGADWSNAVSYDVDFFRWKTIMQGDEYVISGVIDGLEFDTTYSVVFGDYAIDAWSEVYTFTTRKETIGDFGFIYVTDSQEHIHFGGEYSAAKYTLNDAMARFPEAEFIAHGGDVVQNGTFPCAWEDMLLNFDDTHFTYPILPTTGNHERYVYGASAEPNNINKLYNIDYPGVELGDDLTSGVYYSFDYGSMHFISLASNDIYRDGRDLDEIQVAWFKADVQKARQNPNTKWVVVMMHHAIFPNLPYDTDQYYTPQLMKLIDQLDIDLLLFGHGHALTSSYPLVWDETAERDPNYTKVARTSNGIEQVTFDGDVVNKFTYADGTTDYGTVLHQTGCAGSQTGEKYASATAETYPNWRVYLGGKNNQYTDQVSSTGLSMYTYVDVVGDSLVVRTYGVDFTAQKALSNDADILSTGYYLDGYMISR